jgi:cytochrome c556
MKATIYMFLLAALLASCGANKPTAEEAKRNDHMAQKMEDAGYVPGEVIKGSGNDVACEFLVKLADETTVELIEMPEEFRKAGTEVWIKWMPHRRPSVCGFQTGAIVEIQHR